MSRVSVLVLSAVLTACERPDVKLICHNANCFGPTDPQSDDTLPALEASLALEYAGRPAIDGIEIDSFWVGADDRCVFAHDLDEPRTTPVEDAANVIAAHFAKPGPISYGLEPFFVFVELKSHVAKDKTALHTPEQRASHAACAWSIYHVISDAAIANGRAIQVVFSAFHPLLLHAMIDATPTSTPMPYAFGAVYGIPKPLDNQTRPLDEYTGIPLRYIEMHPQWIHDAQWEGVLSADLEPVFWMFSMTTETFAAIQQYEPSMVTTSEAMLLRRWLAY
jgi:hypothetical protein